jgi:hypothetical protein
MLQDPTDSSQYLTNVLLTIVESFRYTKFYINTIWYNKNEIK